MTSPDRDDLPAPEVLSAWTTPPAPDFTASVLDAHKERAMTVTTDPDLFPQKVAASHSAGLWIAVAALALAAVGLGTIFTRGSGDAPVPVTTSLSPTPAGPAGPPGSAAAAASTAAVVVTTDPPEASVRINGRLIEGPTPHVLGTAAVGALHIEVTHEGHEPYIRELDLGPGGLQLPITLRARASDHGAQTEAAAPAPRRRSPDLKDPFSRASKPSKPGKPLPAPKDPFARKDSPDLSDPFAKSKQRTNVKVAVGAGDPPAKVFIDGNPAGMTPVLRTRLAPGRHTVRCVWSDEVEVTVQINTGDENHELVRCRRP